MNTSELTKLSIMGKRTKGLKTLDKVTIKLVSAIGGITQCKLDGDEEKLKLQIGDTFRLISVAATLNEVKNQIVLNSQSYGYALELQEEIKPEDIPELFSNLLEIMTTNIGDIAGNLFENKMDTYTGNLEYLINTLNTICILLNSTVEELWENALNEGDK